MLRKAFWIFPGLAALWFCAAPVWGQSEESVDYFERWLRRDVVYIISEEERQVFEALTTDEEKNRFIEEFWRRRDPDPNTAVNEFREEHFRRVAYANENFAAGKPGWKTDRGMVYIKFGPPDRRQTNPTGGRVYRTQQELLASASANPEQHMTALPFEVWEYRKIEGIGDEVTFEFVAKEGGVDYTLALNPDEKDALFFNTGSHIPKMRDRRRGLKTFRANALDRLETVVAAQRPLPLRAPEEFVSVRVDFSEMPFEVETEVVPGAENALCKVSVNVPRSSLSFDRVLDKYQARVDLEIFVRDIRKLVVAQRSDQVEAELDKSELVGGGGEVFRYDTAFTLPPGRYLVEVWIKDAIGGDASFDSTLVVVSDQTGSPQSGGEPSPPSNRNH